MKTVNVKKMKGGELDVAFTGGHSIRAITESDGLGFSINKTFIKKGGPYYWHYHDRLEACYCISGRGVLTNQNTGDVYSIVPDVIYTQEANEPHLFEALEDTILVTIFNPPLKGHETHNKHGHYV